MTNQALSQHTFYIEVRDSSGALIGAHDDGISLNYVNRVNQIGMMIWTVPDGHAVLSQLVDDLYFLVRIGIPQVSTTPFAFITWYDDFIGVYRDRQISTDEFGNLYHILYIPHANEVLTRSIVAFPSGTSGNSVFSAEDIGTIITNVVLDNVTSGVDAERLRSIDVIPGIASDVPPVVGTSIDYSCAWRPTPEVINELAELAVMDFAVVWENLSGVTLRVKYFTGQLGDDLSATVLFDLGFDNVGQSSLNSQRMQEKTVAIVAGEGEGAARDTAVRTGTNYSTTNSYEVLVDARGKASGELNAFGDARLSTLEAKTSVDAEIIQSQGWLYKRDYDLGDLVTVRFRDVAETRKIHFVSVTFQQDGRTSIKIGLEDA